MPGILDVKFKFNLDNNRTNKYKVIMLGQYLYIQYTQAPHNTMFEGHEKIAVIYVRNLKWRQG